MRLNALAPLAAGLALLSLVGSGATAATGGNAGGGYDTHSRLLAAHLGRHIPGTPDIVVQNMPAGSGIGAANYVYNISKKDGTELGQFNRDALILALLGDKLAKFTLQGFSWLGTPADYSENVFVAAVRGDLPYKDMADIRAAKTPLNFGNTGTVLPHLIKDAMGANIRIIEGYRGDTFLALERGEIDGLTTSYALIKLAHADLLASKSIRIIVQFGREQRLPELSDVPTAMELAQTPADRDLMAFFDAGLHLGFPFAAPPGLPEDRIATLREGFRLTMEDADYVAALRKASLEFAPLTGDRLTAAILQMTQASAETIDRYKRLAGR
jgi:tripartite-type tricarboxylate transporter receptor subunit TctC